VSTKHRGNRTEQVGAYLTEAEAADHLGLKQRTLRYLREIGDGPTYVRATPKTIRYTAADLDVWIVTRKVESTFCNDEPLGRGARARDH
jgi:hypothetical protein